MVVKYAPMNVVPAEGALLERILDESHAIWSDGLTRVAYGRYNVAQLRTPWGARNLRRLALVNDNGDLLSSAKRYDFEARLDGRSVRVVGLGAVFTPEAKRGHGYARELVARIGEQATLDGAELALLFSEIDPDYYAGMGFTAIPRREVVLRLKEHRRGAPMVLVRAGEERDISAVTALARTMTAASRFALEPSDDLVRFSLSKKRLLAGFLAPDLLNVEFFIVEEGAGAVAFAILTATSEDVVLEMCGDRDPAGARVGALLQVLRARNPGEPEPTMSCFLPAGWLPPQVEIASATSVREVMMVRPLREGVLNTPLQEADVLYWHGDLF